MEIEGEENKNRKGIRVFKRLLAKPTSKNIWMDYHRSFGKDIKGVQKKPNISEMYNDSYNALLDIQEAAIIKSTFLAINL